jgi:hypothetical protein
MKNAVHRIASYGIAAAIMTMIPACRQGRPVTPQQNPVTSDSSGPSKEPAPSQPKQAQNSIPEKTALPTFGDTFVPLSDDIDCTLQGMSFWGTASDNGLMSGSVAAIDCRITSAEKGKRKRIPLVSTKLTHGMLTTKDFGILRITVPEFNSPGVELAIYSDKLQSFREFLLK